MSSDAPAAAPAAKSHRAEGRLEHFDGKDLTISHGPVQSISWGAMTMEFKAPAAGLPPGVKAGDPIAFEFVQSPDGSFAVTRIERRGGTKP
jgi:Cu(I)/Ag(I) efflux system membrane fusion protein